MILKLLFFARDATAFPLQCNCPTRKAYTATINTLVDHKVNQCSCPDDGLSVKLWLYPTSTAAARSCWGCASSSSPSLAPTKEQSILATSDTLPNFSTAQGLLSPDVVMRIAASEDLELNGPLDTFLNTYLSRGPMACLFMLSDPNILPELTKAMRAVV